MGECNLWICGGRRRDGCVFEAGWFEGLAYGWEAECAKMALLPIGYSDRRERGSYTLWGIKRRFWEFMGGFGKIFFTKGGIKREKEGFYWGGEREEKEGGDWSERE